MKNLKLSYSKFFTSQLLINADCFCIDGDTETIYFANKQHLFCLEKNSKELENRVLDLGIDDDQCHVISMDYVLDTQFLCLALSSGDIAIYKLLDEKAENVGCVDSGICGTAWSPDQELLLVLTGAETYILMTKGFDPLLEKGLHPEEFGESSFVNVGWGSKETQFHGSEGKGAARIKAADPKKAMLWDDGKPRASWRGDGEFFATSVIDNNMGCRIIRVWNREGSLHYTSEMKDGLEHPLAWRPSGDLITCTHQHPNKHEVIFFEKNGLQHGEFKLPYVQQSFIIKELIWNIDSSILAVWGHYKENNSHFSITLWTVKNYHWYLKQNLDFREKDGFRVKQVGWDSQHQYRLHVLGCDGEYFQYTWKLSTSHSLGINDNDHSSVAIIDNDKVLITPFKKMTVPPPMCAYFFTCPASINHVIFAPSSDDFCTILANGEIAIFKTSAGDIPSLDGYKRVLQAAGGNGFKIMVKPHFLHSSFRVEWENDELLKYPLSLSNWTWSASSILYCIYFDCSMDLSVLCSINTTEETSPVLKGRTCAEIKGTVISMCSNEDGTILALQLNTGQIMKYCQGVLSNWKHQNQDFYLTKPCVQFSLCTIDDKVVVLALSDRCSFYCNNVMLGMKCISYCCHEEFLIITTCDNKLKCFSKRALLDNSSFIELASQPCEGGSNIVCSIPGDTKIILQMPRGNLEILHPRPLVVSTVCKYINSLEYKKAFDLAKEHRINLNIFYDHNPEKFLDSVETFIDQLSSASDLNLFLVSLTNENISKVLYPFQYPESLVEESSNLKRDEVCDSIRIVLQTKSKEDYFDSLMATYSQKTEAELDKALIEIKNVKERHNDSELGQRLADKAMKFLLFMVDVAELYKVALGTYDFNIAVMVAEKSNMDPKEYLAFMNDLRELDEDYRRYKIDIHLERFKQALQNISKCENHFEECLTLIKNQRLYTTAIALFPQGSPLQKIVWCEYGDYLTKKLYLKEAGLAYTCCRDYEKALKAFQDSGDWQLALSSLIHLDYSDNRKALVYSAIAEKLKLQKRFEDAALVLEHYAKDIPKSLSMLIEGQCFESALLTIMINKDCSLLDTKLRPALFDHYKSLLMLITDKQENFIRYCSRLRLVRLKKEQYDDNREDDLFSETSSVSGISSNSQASKQLSGSLITRKSSRSRKKLELKKYRLKEGSANEDLALISELSTIITLVDKLKDNFYPFVRLLVQFDFLVEATLLQQKFKECFSTIEKEMPNIWVTAKQPTEMNFGPEFTTNSILEVIQTQKKTIQYLSDPALAPPKWRKNMSIFLEVAN